MYKKLSLTAFLLLTILPSVYASDNCKFTFRHQGPNRDVFFILESIPPNYQVDWFPGSCYAQKKLYARWDCAVFIEGEGDCQNADFKLLDPKGNLIHVYMEYLSEQAGPQIKITYPEQSYQVTLDTDLFEHKKYFFINIHNK